MNDNDLDVIFLNATLKAMRNGCKKTIIADQLNYSESRFAQKIKAITGLHYKLLDDLIWGSIVWSCVAKHTKRKDAARELCMSEKNLSIYLKRHPEKPSKTITSKETTMRKNGKSAVMIQLATASDPMTLKELNTSVRVIKALRASGIEIVSIPGRYKSGYKLDLSGHSNCLTWVNNWRSSLGKSKLAKIF